MAEKGVGYDVAHAAYYLVQPMLLPRLVQVSQQSSHQPVDISCSGRALCRPRNRRTNEKYQYVTFINVHHERIRLGGSLVWTLERASLLG